MNNQHIIKTISDDAPHGCINWFTISFLTPQKMEGFETYDVRGFKVHNGYTSQEMIKEDIAKLKQTHREHDIFVSQLGKVYAWDDLSKVSELIYDNKKLTSMKKAQQEDLETLKVIYQQKAIDTKIKPNDDAKRANATRQKILQKLHAQGKISKIELESLSKKEEKPDSASNIQDLDAKALEITEDYLTESEPVGLRYGCISIYSPKTIKGLKTLCFKVRGLYETIGELQDRVSRLQATSPLDNVYLFEVGKWTPISEDIKIAPALSEKRLNYCMLKYHEWFENQTKEFEENKKTLLESAKVVETKKTKKKPTTTFGNTKDDANIEQLIEWMNDPELEGKYAVDPSETTEAVVYER